jgi:hypothetical protein
MVDVLFFSTFVDRKMSTYLQNNVHINLGMKFSSNI